MRVTSLADDPHERHVAVKIGLLGLVNNTQSAETDNVEDLIPGRNVCRFDQRLSGQY